MRRLPALLVVVTLALAACGVPLDDAAAPVPGYSRAATAPASSPTVDTQQGTAWFVAGDRLVPRTVSLPSSADVVAALSAAPGDGAVRTLNVGPVDGAPLATGPEKDPTTGEQRVTLSPTFAELSASDQVLLIGQVVLTVSELGREPVLFVDQDGAVLSVPLPDGRVRDGAVTRGDYITLT